MLPTRAYSDTVSSFVAGAARPTPVEERPVIALAVDRSGLNQFLLPSFANQAAHTTADALTLVDRLKPRVVVVDWDCPEIDGNQVVCTASRSGQTGILVATARTDRAPAAIKAGCHTLLLKPFAPNLAAGRIGRLCREMTVSSMGRRPSVSVENCCTHRTWPGKACPECQAPGATSFEFSSYRRMWYACLACEHVWLDRAQE